jgi:hypothetical protein
MELQNRTASELREHDEMSRRIGRITVQRTDGQALGTKNTMDLSDTKSVPGVFLLERGKDFSGPLWKAISSREDHVPYRPPRRKPGCFAPGLSLAHIKGDPEVLDD